MIKSKVIRIAIAMYVLDEINRRMEQSKE